MRGAWQLGRVAGIVVQVHWTFLLLIGWVVLMHTRAGGGAGDALRGVVLTLAVFACVVLHEFGHALTARRYGIGTRDITLLPIGGVARLARMPEDPRQELLVAAAGPAVNVLLAGMIAAVLWITGSRIPVTGVTLYGSRFLEQLMGINVVLVIFNLLPAFPMDGGRILRGALALRLPYLKATRWAAATGQTIAVALGFAGITMASPFLVLIALFVFSGARAEARMVEMRARWTDLGGRAAPPGRPGQP
jgi:Zn-dependent protease